MLHPCPTSLSGTYDLVMLDLDGVVYVGRSAVAGAADHLARARETGAHLAFVTNNGARPPGVVARHLEQLGIAASPEDVVTSAQAASRLVEDVAAPGSRVLCLGGEGVEEALRERGFRPVHDVADEPAAVVSAYGPELRWLQIVRAAVLIRDGLPWVACNTDLTIPIDLGIGPGHGVLVRMLSEFTGVEPPVAGKPAPPLLRETIARVGGAHPLMVGDRLDTDILGARRVGVDSLLVLTGVTGIRELVAAPADQRPTYLSVDLAGLNGSHPPVERVGDGWASGGWIARTRGGRLDVDWTGGGDAGGDAGGDGGRAAGGDDWWRCLAAAAWAHLDETGHPADTGDLERLLPDRS